MHQVLMMSCALHSPMARSTSVWRRHQAQQRHIRTGSETMRTSTMLPSHTTARETATALRPVLIRFQIVRTRLPDALRSFQAAGEHVIQEAEMTTITVITNSDSKQSAL